LKKKLLFISALSGLLTVPAAFATVLYTNGPVNGNGNAWNIAANQFSVSDSFTLAAPGTVNAFDFATWIEPSGTLTSVNWALGSSSFGSDIDSGTGTLGVNMSTGVLTSNSFGFNVDTSTVTGLNDALSAGTYWLTLSVAVVTNGDPIYWDENDGPSAAYQESVGGTPYTLPNGDPCANGQSSCTGSETFDLITNSSTPEPGALGLIGCGLLAMAGIMIRRKTRTA
jgi:hypothetical protein